MLGSTDGMSGVSRSCLASSLFVSDTLRDACWVYTNVSHDLSTLGGCKFADALIDGSLSCLRRLRASDGRLFRNGIREGLRTIRELA